MPFQASERDRASFVRAVRRHRKVDEFLRGARHRLISLRPVESLEDKDSGPVPPKRWEARFFDYTNNRVVKVQARFPAGAGPVASVSREFPVPTEDEWAEALELVRSDRRFGRSLERGSVAPFHPMPPLALAQDSGGEVERVLHVGLRARGRGTKAQIVAVNLIRQEVTSYGDVGPVQAPLTEGDCQAPSEASCDVQTSGPPGQCWISWPSSSPLWTFLAIRPSASSGQNASGVELRYVDYQGKRVLYQAHIPIL
ncbi:MAG TPA: hypothetical protein VF972_04485, partial [Actinomycetota bacterium]